MTFNILIISGSLAEHSHTRELAAKVGDSVQRERGDVTIWHLADAPLPFADPSFHWKVDDYPDERVARLIEAVRHADGLVLASPLYHGSYAGVLKNALDLLWMDAFSNKPVGLVSHGASIRLCSRPIDALRPVVQTMYGYVAQTSVATCRDDYTTCASGDFTLVDPRILERIDRLSMELMALCRVLNSEIPKEDDGTDMRPKVVS